MTCHVIYTKTTGSAKVKSFKETKYAEDFIEENETEDDYTSMQIVVDYALVDFYRTKFEELYKVILQKSGMDEIPEIAAIPKIGGAI